MHEIQLSPDSHCTMHGLRVERKKDRVVKKRRGRKREKKTKFIIKVVWVERKASEIRPLTIRPEIKQTSPQTGLKKVK